MMDIGLRKCPRVYVGSTKRSTSGPGTTRFLDTWRVAFVDGDGDGTVVGTVVEVWLSVCCVSCLLQVG